VRISKQIRSVTAKFPAQRNRELLLLEQGILNNGTGNVFAQSGNRCRSTPIALASCRKTSLQADAGGPIAIPEQMATTPALGFLRRSASSRFWQGRWPSRCLGIAASCHAERIRRSRQSSLAGSPLSAKDAPAPGYEIVARAITGDDPPAWLVKFLKMWGPCLAVDRGVAAVKLPTRAQMRKTRQGRSGAHFKRVG
jgi:hypothetical protein